MVRPSLPSLGSMALSQGAAAAGRGGLPPQATPDLGSPGRPRLVVLRPPAPTREQRLWRILWSDCPGVGVVRLQQLERLPGGLAAAWAAAPDALARLTGWGDSLLASIEAYRRCWGGDPLTRLACQRQGGRGLLLPCDRRWPSALQALARPPLWLHWQGRGALWPLLARRQAVAVVGTRHPSDHGLLMAHRIGSHLAAHGWPVVSGLAEGIDAAAHRGCLSRGGAPVAALGTPLQRVYPRHHGPLQAEVGQRGLLLSEWSPGAPVRPGHFASRNRLLVALAAAVVVVECPPQSGALHSAELAWQQGLPLWAVPGDAARPVALGSNRLLARGATPLLQPSDLTDQLGPGPLAGRTPLPAVARGIPLEPDGTAARVLAALGDGAGLEDLGRRLALAPPVLSAALLQLELAGLVRPEPGLRWRPC